MVLSSIGFSKQWGVYLVPFVGFYIGWFLDTKETERMVSFRDKSALYGRTLKEGEKPSWPWFGRETRLDCEMGECRK